MIDVFTISSTGLPKGTRVIGFRGTEGISRLYTFEVYLGLGPDEAESFDLADAVGARATLALDRRDGKPPFTFHGVFSDVALVHHEKDGLTIARAALVPRLWHLTQSLHSRLFTKASIPDIIKEILDKSGIPSDDYALKLSQQYPVEEHVCQYAESDFDFISRWMEREGMYYFFEQGDEAERLVIADGRSVHEDLAPAPIRFFAHAGGDLSAGESLHTFVCRRRSLPASVRFKDYDYTKPTLQVSGDAPVSKNGAGEISIHGARFWSPDAGKRLAQLRAEEILAREVIFTGHGSAFFLRAGYTFSLQDHPRSAFDASYLAIEVEHTGNQSASSPELRRLTGLDGDDVYQAHVTAIPAAVQFRAEARTSWPRIYGTEHGIIDGEADSEYAQLDEHGRYAVRFAFDENDLEAGKASTRVRMMQPHGGGVEGWHFPLRKGTEVLFTFLGGDPDRPVIAGVVPNAHTPSPVTSSNHTKNVIQTGGRNRFELEDKAGQERITLSTPHSNTYIRMGAPNDEHNMIVRTDGRTELHAGQDWDVTVGQKLTEDVYGNVEERYHSKQDTEIAAGRKETIQGGGMTHDITGGWFQTVKGDGSQTITGAYAHTVGGAVNATYGSHKIMCGPGQFVYASVHASTGPVVVEAPSVAATAPITTFNASASFTVNSPSIKLKTGSNIKSFAPESLDSFGTKISLGAVKFDGTYLKSEANAYSIGWWGVKGEDCGISKVSNAVTFDHMGAHVHTAITYVHNAALTKFG